MPRPAPPVAAAAVLGGLLAASLLPSACTPPAALDPPSAPSDEASRPAGGDVPAPTSAVSSLPDDTGWEPVAAGVERRRLAVRGEARLLIDRMLIVRLDPAAVRFDVGYAPGAPRALGDWHAASGALLVVNGGYFTAEGVATGLVISGGTPSGASYGAFAGMFAVGEAGPDVRWLGERPYDPAEPLQAALQAFPMLVRPGGQPGVAEGDVGPEVARRTWIGMDRSGRVLVGVAPSGGLSLAALSAWLAAADLDLDRALNLDGGGSTGLVLGPREAPVEAVPAFDALPAVILAYAR